jgi:uncharacterized protein
VVVDTSRASDERRSGEHAFGSAARTLDDDLSVVERMRVPRTSVRRIVLVGGLYAFAFVCVFGFAEPVVGVSVALVPLVAAFAFAFEMTDSAAGMGFGTALAPALFALGFDPIEVVPVLLFSELFTGLTAGLVHHELDNVTFSVRPLNDETRLLGLLALTGSVAGSFAIVLVYLALSPPETAIKVYVALLVVAMGGIGLLRAGFDTTVDPHPRRLVGFALLAGINKGIGGGGYGPVVTLGQVLSGVYEKSAVAITSLAEGIVSLVGALTFLVIATQGVGVDLRLLPSVLLGGVFAAIVSPYVVRVVPNAVWRYLIPVYALGIGIAALVFGVGL